MQKYMYISCFSDTCTNIRFRFFRTRENGLTYYRASAIPVALVKHENGIESERYTPIKGYKATLGCYKRASKTALEMARRELEVFINEAVQALENDGFTPGVFDVYSISQSIVCEVI